MKIPVIKESRHCNYAQVSVPIGSQRCFRTPFLDNFRVAVISGQSCESHP
jgi:hypothetical protein